MAVNPFAALTQTVLTKRGQDIHRDIAEKRLAEIRRRNKALYGGYEKEPGAKGFGQVYKPGLEQQRLDIAKGTLGIAQRRLELEEQSGINKWNKFMSGKPNAANLLKLAQTEEAFEPIVKSIISKMGKGEVKTRFDAYQYLKQNETMMIKSTRENIMKDIETSMKKGDFDAAEVKSQMLNQIVPGFLEDFFGFPEQYRAKRPAVDLTYPTLRREISKGSRMEYGNVQKDERGLQFQLGDNNRRYYLPNQMSIDERMKVASEAEETILNPASVDEEFGPMVQSKIDLFNSMAPKPYIYWYDPGEVTEWFDGKSDRPPSVKKIPLPKTKDGQVLAFHIMQTIRRHPEYTYEDVLEMLGISPSAE